MMITEADALAMAEKALANIQGASPPYQVHFSDGSWVVGSAAVDGLSFAVRIDGHTGQTLVEAYRTVIIDEEF